MHELMKKLEKSDRISETLLCWSEEEVAKGKCGADCCDIEALGQVIDMVKDLAEANEKWVKAKYYETVTMAMEEYDEEESERYGYDNWRYASGRFAPKGRGHRSGYTPDLMMYEDEKGVMHTGKFGYPMPMEYHPRYGKAYDEYRDAKRYYTQTGDESSKHQMDEKIEESLMDTMDAFAEMYEDASPEVRKRMVNNTKSMLKDWEEKLSRMV